ncbi:MAG: TolC family protein [Cyclobacteriaceae bacterium]|nr:TolC family protein [Cyclobacteriaceae bacterium]
MKYFIKVSSFILFILISRSVNSQDKPASAFTLDESIKYALEHSYSVKNASLDEEAAKAKVKETIGIGLPQIDGAAGVQYNPKLSRFFSTYSGPNGFLGDLSGVPGIQPGDVVAAQNFFQLKSNGDVNVAINQILFNGSYLVGLKAASSYKELSTKMSGQTREQTISQVSKAFYLALTNQERIKLFDSNLARVDSLLRTTTALNQSGFAEKIDVDRVRVTYNNLATERRKFENIQSLAYELLKFQMNYPMNEAISIIGSLEDIQVPDLSSYQDHEYTKRWDYQVAQTNVKLKELDLKNQYAASIPSLVAFAKMGYATQSPTISGLFKTNSGISDNGVLGPDKWYGYSLLGVSLSVPIFSGLQRNYRVQQSRLNLLKTENSVKQLETAIDLEVKQARITFDNSVQTMQSQKENMELAANIARVTKIKYEQGLGSNLEVVDAEAALREAQINFYNSTYDAIVAKIDLDKAYGNLYPTETSK